MQNLHMQDLQLFILVANTKSINKTAKLQLLDQSSISRKMKNLEEILDCKLFVRSGTGVTLTSSGKYLYDFAEKVVNSFIDLKSHLNQEISIGTYESIANYKFPEYFSQISHFVISNDPQKLLQEFKLGNINTLIIDKSIALQLDNSIFKEKLFTEPCYLVSSNPIKISPNLILHPKSCPINQKIRKNLKNINNIQETEFSSSLLEIVKRTNKVTVLPETIITNLSDFNFKKLDSSFDRDIVYVSRIKGIPESIKKSLTQKD